MVFAMLFVAAVVVATAGGLRGREGRRQGRLLERSADPNLEPKLNVWGHGYHYRLGALSREFRKRKRGGGG